MKEPLIIKPEWVEVAMNIVRFFFQHSTIEFDGEKKSAKVQYHGPNGWKVSMSTSFMKNALLDNQNRALEQWESNQDCL